MDKNSCYTQTYTYHNCILVERERRLHGVHRHHGPIINDIVVVVNNFMIVFLGCVTGRAFAALTVNSCGRIHRKKAVATEKTCRDGKNAAGGGTLADCVLPSHHVSDYSHLK